MSEQEAAIALGRTKQSLYQARLDERDDYFKQNDVIALIFASIANRTNVDFEDVYAYVLNNPKRGQKMLSAIESVRGKDAQDEDFERYSEIWVILPDVSFFRSRASAGMVLLKFLFEEKPNTRFFVANLQDKALLQSELGKADIVPETWMGAIPFMIIGDPSRDADCYIYLNGRFMRHEWYGGPKLALMLKTLVEEDLIPKADS